MIEAQIHKWSDEDARPLKGFVDGDKTTLKCSSCNKCLVDIWVVKPSSEKTPVQATCPFCGDKSYVIKIEGDYRFGPVGKEVIRQVGDESVEDFVEATKVVDVQELSDRRLFVIAKH